QLSSNVLQNRSKHLEKVHVVLGSKSCDLDSLISAVAYAYFLDKISPPDVLCLPVLNIPRRDFSFFTETRFILEELNIPESFHIFRDEINLHQLNAEGKLSLTLTNSNMLTRYCILYTREWLTGVTYFKNHILCLFLNSD
uniref:Prune exopolyphosphatase 1 n=1 Tax=Meleagris gallopavo TaxID=9103 RepID=A0A803XN32_MELGA